MATVYEPISKCQKCQGPVWDNRKDKKSPKHPDFKCKDKECGEAFWLGEPKVGKPTKSTFVPKDLVDLPTLYDECLTVAIAQLARQAAKHEKLGVPAHARECSALDLPENTDSAYL